MIGIIIAVIIGILLIGLVLKLIKIAIIVALAVGHRHVRAGQVRDQADQMTIVAIIVALVLAFLAFRFVTGHDQVRRHRADRHRADLVLRQRGRSR